MDSNSEIVEKIEMGEPGVYPSKKAKIVRAWEQDGKSENHHFQKCLLVRDMLVPWRVYYIQHVGAT